MIKKVTLFMLLVSTIVTSFVSFYAPPGLARAEEPAEFREADTADAVSFHPYLTTDTASSSYQGMVYAGGLLRRDPETLKLIPDLATEVPTVENGGISEDFTTYTFHLRKDVFWSDGEPLTAYDFEFTWDNMMKPENEFPYRGIFEFIESYKALDEYTIQVKVKPEQRLCAAIEGVDAVSPALPKHIWEKLDWKDPEKNPEIMHPSISSGPFKLVEWVKDDHVIFEANDTYYRGRPKLDRYTIVIVPEQEVAYAMLKSGEVDTAPVTPENYEDAKADPNLKVYEWWLAAGVWSYIGFNMRRPHLQDVRVRQALSYALDKEQIIDKVMNNLARRIYSVFMPGTPDYTEDLPHYDYDPEKAREILAEAGYTPGPNGILEKDGKPLKLKLLFGPNTSKVREQISVITQAQFKEIGVEVEIRGLEWGAYLEATQKEPWDWDLCVSGWRATLEPHWMYPIWRSEGFPDLNFVAYSNKKVDELFDKASVPETTDNCSRDVRAEIYKEISRLLAEDAPYIFLFQNLSYTGINRRIGGIKPTPIGIGYNLEEWYVKSEEELKSEQ